MVGPLVFGVVASSSLVAGAVVGAYADLPETLTATTLAFASGALITALVFDLFQEAFELGGSWVAGGGLLFGAGVFAVVDYWLDEVYGNAASGPALLASVTLDGVPENLALGVTLLGSVSPFALLVAIFASNFPEALSGTKMMEDNDYSKTEAVGIWTLTAGLLTLAVVVGNVVFAGFSEATLAATRAIAGGAVLASLADEVMPDAYKDGGPFIAFATAAGFLLTFLLK